MKIVCKYKISPNNNKKRGVPSNQQQVCLRIGDHVFFIRIDEFRFRTLKINNKTMKQRRVKKNTPSLHTLVPNGFVTILLI